MIKAKKVKRERVVFPSLSPSSNLNLDLFFRSTPFSFSFATLSSHLFVAVSNKALEIKEREEENAEEGRENQRRRTAKQEGKLSPPLALQTLQLLYILPQK